MTTATDLIPARLMAAPPMLGKPGEAKCRLSDRMIAACLAEGIDLQVTWRDDLSAVSRDYDATQNVMIWGVKWSHRRYARDPNKNVLYFENGLLNQQNGVFVDAMGFWTDSSIVQRKEWERAVTDKERDALRNHVKRSWGVEMFQGGDPNGPILVALQHRTDAPCVHYFPELKRRDPIQLILFYCHRSLPKGVPVIVRPHPRFMDEFQRREDVYRRYLRKGWTISSAGRIYDILPTCRAVVTINSTVATEALAFGIPVATVGLGTFTGANVTLECAERPQYLSGLPDWRCRPAAAEAYLCTIMRHQIAYHARQDAVAANEAFQTWINRAKAHAKGNQP